MWVMLIDKTDNLIISRGVLNNLILIKERKKPEKKERKFLSTSITNIAIPRIGNKSKSKYPY